MYRNVKQVNPSCPVLYCPVLYRSRFVFERVMGGQVRADCVLQNSWPNPYCKICRSLRIGPRNIELQTDIWLLYALKHDSWRFSSEEEKKMSHSLPCSPSLHHLETEHHKHIRDRTPYFVTNKQQDKVHMIGVLTTYFGLSFVLFVLFLNK